MASNLKKLENLVRGGRFDEVQDLLQKFRKTERTNLVALGNIAWRVQRPQMTVKMLNPLARSTTGFEESLCPAERIEYAEGLRRVGVIDKAWMILNEVSAEEFPQAHLYKAFCLFNQWRYREALPILRQYLRADLDEYKRCVGRVNLAAALVQVADLEEAQAHLLQLKDICSKSNYTLLYGNTLEIMSQLFILKKDFDAALIVLQEARNLLQHSGPLFSLFVEKWTAIAESLKVGRCTQALLDVYQKAKQIPHWESARDCDLYIAILTQDQSRLEHLYFGTSFECFRERILKLAGPQFQLPRSYVWSSQSSPQNLLDIASGKRIGSQASSLPIGQALHRFLILLCQDLYRPVSTISAFNKLFPGEFMNVETSANRIHQIVKRCREWIAEVGLNLQIEESEGGYRLVLGEDAGVILSARLPLDAMELEWLLIQEQFGSSSFGITDVRLVLASSTSKAHRLLRWALEQGRVQRFGKGPGTIYLIPSRHPSIKDS